MTMAVVSPFDFSEVMNKNNKMLNYNNNNILSSPHHAMSTPTGALLDRDRKAVGTPSLGRGVSVYHSVTLPNPSSKFHQNQFLNSLKISDPSSCSVTSGLISGSNKETRMRDRSFSETGERLLQKCLGPASPTSLGCNSQSQQQSQVNSSRYKTELCRPFEENGACKYGDKCQFAHGIHELRSLSRHPKYKTELCRTFHTIGFCPYGPRCHFIHNAEERRGPPPGSSSFSPLSSNKLERPRLQHSYSFAGFPSSGGLRGEGSLTPTPMFSPEEMPEWPSCNPFTYSSQELANLFGPSLGSGGPAGTEPNTPAPLSPTNTPYFFRPMSESPTQMFESPSSPPQDSLSDQEGYQSSSGGSLSGSESPSLDTNRRLPIFSRLSVSDD
ncbi:mRNA decay activator protein ZFP36L1a isoform X1 [Oncorhynchus kisutch]|uniref:mRNA decay activator protein ZFP36 n=2 Tax=Oncorhynchus kisutch TaxID=8019 RepID=A0A8C7G244_ONCKI|nr:mRNA decay activator protein ZFP36L1-like isoform X1 [Oncorhynchus kisutch]